MLKLFKTYLKPFLAMLIIAVLLLVGQAIFDLSLPGYMSNIVNVGIQQGGVENAVPQVLTKQTYNSVLGFAMEKDVAKIEDSYEILTTQNKNYADIANVFPNVRENEVYVLKEITKEENTALNSAMAYPLASVTTLNSMTQNTGETKIEGEGENKDAQITIPKEMQAFMGYYATLPQGTSFSAALSGYENAPEVMAELKTLLKERLGTMDESMLVQMAVPSISAEYKALGADMTKYSGDYIAQTGIIMLLLALGSVICSVLVGLISSKIGAGIARDLRNGVFSKVESFSNVEFDKFSTASLITRSTNDITQIQMTIIIMIRMVVYAPLMGIGGIIMANARSTSMSWTIALAVIVLIGMIISIFASVMPKFKIMQTLVDKLNLVTRENLSGMMVIRAFNTQNFELNRFDKANEDLTKTNLFVNRIMVLLMPVMMFVMNGVSVLIIWVGATQISASSIQVGDIMAFMQFAMQILMSFLMLSMIFIMLPRASVSAKRVMEVIDTEPEIVDSKNPKPFRDVKGVLEFKDVCFAYPGAEDEVLSNITFTAKPGETTAFIGSTGSGKSTIANLIPRFYDVTRGSVTIDGTDIREVTQHDLHEAVGYVTQKSVLFSGDIESNLRLGKQDATKEEMEISAKNAQAMEFISKNEDGFKANIAQGGANVSGGQKQRLSIARALVKDPKIYLFDDSFSALDFKTDAILRNAIKDQTKDKTVIIIAQRVGTIMGANQIIVLNEGKIVGKGTHKELMESCEEYKEIALSQLSLEELQ